MKESTAYHSSIRDKLYPFAEMRPVAEIRAGILSIREKWEHILKISAIASGELLQFDWQGEHFRIPGNWIPSRDTAQELLAAARSGSRTENMNRVLEYPWQLIQWSDTLIREDFDLLTRNRLSQPLPATVECLEPVSIFVEEGARLQHCVLNASTGPIYIGKNAEVMEGSLIRGPFSLGPDSVIRMGSRIYGATSLGPGCVAGGELKNSILFGYSNKAHDGYLGDSVLAEWCNLGAGTTNSNLKNTAEEVEMLLPRTGHRKSAGLKCGLFMGDFSRSAINTSFNTGTLVGICAHVFGTGLTPHYVPDFSWGSEGNQRYNFEKAIRDISNWKNLKNKSLSAEDIQILKSIFDR